ncbi:NUDIX hydrolase [Halobacillus campisalis]|uniref:NUDIX hydrolase n=1 Tax=Halobacillus campisalis TaxID=435909 RepID=A0ABW2JZB1_9BACI|nr:CoA pyrophosphatase [Halobacillus campisalis]
MERKTITHTLKNHTPSVIGQKELNHFSILVPLIEKDGELHLLFEVRSLEMRRQPGEICFPGGKVDRRESPQEAAVREAKEELGIEDGDFGEVYPFDYMLSPFGRMMVDTYVGFLDCTEESIQSNPAEVEEVFTVPLSFFKRTKPKVHYVNFEVKPEDGFPFDLIANGEDYEWQTRKMEEYFYQYEGRVIWGLTARILAAFVDSIE